MHKGISEVEAAVAKHIARIEKSTQAIRDRQYQRDLENRELVIELIKDNAVDCLKVDMRRVKYYYE